MEEGLLWYDADVKRPVAQKIDAAVNRYRERFGRGPNCCHVHPDEVVAYAGVQVLASPRILRHHYWVGVDPSLPGARLSRRRGAA